MRSLALPSAGRDLAHSPAQWAGLPTARPLRARQSGQNTKTHQKLPNVSLLHPVSLYLRVTPPAVRLTLVLLPPRAPRAQGPEGQRRPLRGAEGAYFGWKADLPCGLGKGWAPLGHLPVTITPS